MFWTVMALMALFGSGCSPVTLSRILIRTFDQARGSALGFTLIGTGLAAAVAPVVVSPVISAFGWRAGYFALSGVMVVSLPLMLVLLSLGSRVSFARRAPPAVGRADGVSRGRTFGRPFVRLSLAFFLIALATGGVVVHLVPMLIGSGYLPHQAGRVASLLGLSLLVSRLVTGIATDWLFAPRLATVLMGISAVGFALLAAGSEVSPYVVLPMGLSLGAEIDLIAYLASRYFPSWHYGRVFGVLYAAFLSGVALSPLLYGRLYDLDHNYRSAFGLAATFLAISSILFATLPRYPKADSPG
jgi:MFS family permease